MERVAGGSEAGVLGVGKVVMVASPKTRQRVVCAGRDDSPASNTSGSFPPTSLQIRLSCLVQ